MRKIFTIVAFLHVLMCYESHAQVVSELKRVGARKSQLMDTVGWKRTGVLILNINQSSQSYWSGGGESFLIGINGILNNAVHHRKGKYTFDAYFDLELGVVEAASFKQFRKTADRCDLTFEAEHSIGKNTHLSYGILGNINTQIFRGRNYYLEGQPKISNLLSPGKFLISLGLDYKDVNPKHYLSVFATPLTVRWVTKVDKDFYPDYKFGVDSFAKVNTEIGALITVHYNSRFNKNLNLISRLDLFSNYKRKPENVDILFNNVITYTFARSFAATIIFDVLYDDDIRQKTQVQQILGLGLRFKF